MLSVCSAGGQALFGQHLEQGFAPTRRVGAQQDTGARARDQGAQLAYGIFGAAGHGHVGRGNEIRMRRLGRQRQARKILEARVQGLAVQEQGRRRQHRTLPVAFQEVVAAGRVLRKTLYGFIDIAQRDCERAGVEVVEQRGRLFEEQRQVVLHAGEGDAVADVLVGQGARWIAFEDLAETRAEMIARGLVHGKFAPGQQPHLAHGIEAALGVDVERADGFDFVVEQVQAVGHGRAHGKQIDQPAAQAKFARRRDLGHMVVVRQRQLRAQRRFVQLVALPEREGVGGQEGRRRQAVQRRRDGHGQDIDRLGHERVQGVQALGDQVLVRRKGVVGQGFPVGKLPHAQLRREKRDFVGQALGLQRIGREHDNGFAGLAGQIGQQPAVARTGGARLDIARPGFEGGQGGGGGRQLRIHCGGSRGVMHCREIIKSPDHV